MFEQYSTPRPYAVGGKNTPSRERHSGRHAKPGHPYGMRFKPGRKSCPLCGFPLRADVDGEGNCLGLVCVSSGGRGEGPNGGCGKVKQTKKACPNYNKIVTEPYVG